MASRGPNWARISSCVMAREGRNAGGRAAWPERRWRDSILCGGSVSQSAPSMPSPFRTAARSFPVSYSIDLSGRVAFITGASGGLGAQFAKHALAGRRRRRAGQPPHRETEGAARADRGRGRRRARAEPATSPTSTASAAAVAHAETEVGSIDILVNNSGVSTTQRIQDVTARRLRLHLRHQRARRVLRGAGDRQAHARPRAWRGARHVHRRPHHQHRVDGRR
jgi:hypothetical protein